MVSRNKRMLRYDASEASPRPTKKVNLGFAREASESTVHHTSVSDVTTIMMEESDSAHLHLLPGLPLTAPGATRLGKPSIITPLNSFHELRQASQVFQTTTEPLRPKEVRTTEPDDSSQSSGESLVFQLSVEKNEDLVAASDPFFFCDDGLKRVLLAEQYDAKSYTECREESMKHLESTFEKSPLSAEISSQPTWGPSTLILITVLLVVAYFFFTPRGVVIEDPASIYVPGGGFSGFWYTLGRLNSIKDPLSQTYYCYSAGCLGVVAMLGNCTMESTYDYAIGARTRWQRGELSRFDVTKSFVDDLLYGPSLEPLPTFEDPRVLSTLRIITSEPRGSMNLKAAIRTPGNVDELKDMLLQTAWIPFAVGSDLWHKRHIDGAFTLPEHPQCSTRLGYGLDLDIILNALNMNLSYEKVKTLWQKGLSVGI